MPVYGNASEAEPFQQSRDLPLEKRIELYEFNFENDENEIPSKKFKKRKPREKKKVTKFFDNIGKNVPVPKPRKVTKKCVEEVPKRVLPKRGALRSILAPGNVPSTYISSIKNTGQPKSNLITSISSVKNTEQPKSKLTASNSSVKDTGQPKSNLITSTSSVKNIEQPKSKLTASNSCVKNTGQPKSNLITSTSSVKKTEQPKSKLTVSNSSGKNTGQPKSNLITSISSTKNTGQPKSNLMKSKENSYPLSSSVNSFGSFNISKNSDKSRTSNIGSVLKESSHNSLFNQSNFIDSFNQGSYKPSSLCGNLLHDISFNDLNKSVADKGSRKQSPIDNFKIPASVTVRNLRTRSKKTNVPQCSSHKRSTLIRCSSPKSSETITCSSPNISKSPDRTLLFGATSPIRKRTLSSGSLSSVGNENISFNSLGISNVKSFNSSVKSFGNESCLITGNHDDSYKSVGEEDLCHYFGFDEEEEEEPCLNLVQKVPKTMNRKKTKVEVAQLEKPEKPPVDEILSLLKSSVPANSNSPEHNPEPFTLSSHIWSPLKSEAYDGTKEAVKKPVGSKRGRTRTKPVHEKPVLNIFDDGEEQEFMKQTSKKESKPCLDPKEETEKDEDVSISSEKELTHKRCHTKPKKMAESKPVEKLDEAVKQEARKVNSVYKAPKRVKETNKQVKDRKEAEGNKKEMDEFEALAASLNSQFQEIEHFKLAVE